MLALSVGFICSQYMASFKKKLRKYMSGISGEALELNKKLCDLSDLEEYRELVSKQPETEFQKIELDIIDRALINLRNGYP
jgi:hypothetical protein